MKKLLQRRAVGLALQKLLEEDESVLLLGEDIGVYGGAFQVTSGLQKKFPNRVLETPISESGFTGLATGLAMGGYKPIVEYMFMDFTSQAVDQILNHAVKFNGMYNGAVDVPVLYRTPAGGYRQYAATHSQSLENMFASVHDLQIVYPYSAQDYYSMLIYLVRNLKSPTMFIENKTLYLKKGEIDLDLVYAPQPKMIKEGSEETLFVSYGHAIDVILEAEKQQSEDWSILDLCCLKPICNFEYIYDKIVNSGRVFFVSESPSYASIMEHLLYLVYKRFPGHINFTMPDITIISSKDSFIPARIDKEKETLLSVEQILNEVL